MNIIDKFVESVSPQKALLREQARIRLEMVKAVKNSGYDEGGGSTVKNSMKGWNASSKDAFNDIDKNLDLLRQRSRSLFMSAPIATSAIRTTRTNVVGSGLKLKCRIDFNLLGISQEEADSWEKRTEKEFNLWAESKFCDALRLNNFYELQQLSLMSWLMNGDSITLIKRAKTERYMPYGLRLHVIEADRVCNPNTNGKVTTIPTAQSGNRIINGVEIDSEGAVTAYHICNMHPKVNGGSKKWQRIQAFGTRTGLPNVLHVMDAERPEQYRGVPLLAPVIESLKQLTRYTEAELMAAVINGFFTVFVTSDNPDDKNNEFAGGSGEENESSTADADYRLGPGLINILKPGEKIETADPKRPNINFDGFVSSMCKYVGAALEIPPELLIKAFSASYSASRGALMEAWKAFRMKRSWFATDFCQPVYEIFLAEAVSSGRITAPGFFNDPAIMKAYCTAEWNGPAPGQLDPVKEVNAAEKRIQLGLSTRERETIEMNGGDFDRNVEQLKLESEKMKDIQGEEKQQ